MNAPANIPDRRVDARFLPDLRRLERAITALIAAKPAASAGTLFASKDGLVAIEAIRRLLQSDDLETLYGEVWAEAGCPLSDEIDEGIRLLSERAADRRDAA